MLEGIMGKIHVKGHCGIMGNIGLYFYEQEKTDMNFDI